MSRHWKLMVTDDEAGERLDRFLAARVAALSRGAVRQLIDQGAAWISGRRVKRASHAVCAGDAVELFAPDGDVRPPPPPREILRVVYESGDLVVVDKPPGIAVQVRREAEAGSLEWALRAVQRAAGRRRPYAGVVHRLDLPASGLVVLAQNPGAAADLSRQFAAHLPDRRYHALVGPGMTWEEQLVDLPLNVRGRRARVDLQGGKPARTRLRVLRRAPRATLVEAVLETGRTHQVRAHLAAVGYPILGDRLYGARTSRAGANEDLPPSAPIDRLALHAYELGFDHPRTGKRLRFTSELPEPMRVALEST